MYKLTHVQTTLRNELSEDIKDDKVHPSNTRLVNDSLNKNKDEIVTEEKNKRKKKIFTIDAFNYYEGEFPIEVEKVDNDYSGIDKGVFIDKKK